MQDEGHMRRTTITWPEEMARAVERTARRRKTSVSAMVRELVGKQLSEERKTSPFAAMVGVINDPKVPNAVDMDAELAKTWADAIANDR